MIGCGSLASSSSSDWASDGGFSPSTALLRRLSCEPGDSADPFVAGLSADSSRPLFAGVLIVIRLHRGVELPTLARLCSGSAPVWPTGDELRPRFDIGV